MNGLQKYLFLVGSFFMICVCAGGERLPPEVYAARAQRYAKTHCFLVAGRCYESAAREYKIIHDFDRACVMEKKAREMYACKKQEHVSIFREERIKRRLFPEHVVISLLRRHVIAQTESVASASCLPVVRSCVLLHAAPAPRVLVEYERADCDEDPVSDVQEGRTRICAGDPRN